MKKKETLKETLKRSLVIGSLSGIIYTILIWIFSNIGFLEALLLSPFFLLGWFSMDILRYFIQQIKNKTTQIIIWIVFACSIAGFVGYSIYTTPTPPDYRNAELVIGLDTLGGSDTLDYRKYTKEQIENLEIIIKE